MKRLKLFLPGLLVAATGVGSADLIIASLSGYHLGLSILWVAIVGAIFKYFLTEGITRYQFASGETLLQGWITKLHPSIKWIFIFYLVIWTYMVAGALINAGGAAFNNIVPIKHGSIIYGIAQSLIAVMLVRFGSYKIFELIMSFLVIVMFITVIGTSFFFIDAPIDYLKGFLPTNIMDISNPWIIGLMGSVGGTVTILSYGYWIKEHKRSGLREFKRSQIDLRVSYTLTALFSISMIVIGSKLINVPGGKSAIIPLSAALIKSQLGFLGQTVFLFGFWGGVFSSLLGVWQSVPYMFADIYYLHYQKVVPDLKKTKTYFWYLLFIGIIPLSALWIKFDTIQLVYAVMGALFIPMCAISILILNNRIIKKSELKNGKMQNIFLILALLFFLFAAIRKFF